MDMTWKPRSSHHSGSIQHLWGPRKHDRFEQCEGNTDFSITGVLCIMNTHR
jgi:hypothetical protein